MAKKSSTQIANEIRTKLTNQVIEMLEAGTSPWTRPWGVAGDLGGLQLRENGEPYKGTNQFLLGMVAAFNGYTSPFWMTFNKAKALGGMVRKGEKGQVAVYYKRIKIKDKETGEEKYIPMLKSYAVFNADQIDDLPAKYHPAPLAAEAQNERLAGAEEFFNAVGADVRFGGQRAFYAIAADFVQMPAFEQFHTSVGYYSTLAHEFGHWTGHGSRLDRTFGGSFGDKTYAKEELVAEMSAMFTLGHLGVATEPSQENASYLQSWLKNLREDPKFLMNAATAAQEATDHLVGCAQPQAMAAE